MTILGLPCCCHTEMMILWPISRPQHVDLHPLGPWPPCSVSPQSKNVGWHKWYINTIYELFTTEIQIILCCTLWKCSSCVQRSWPKFMCVSVAFFHPKNKLISSACFVFFVFFVVVFVFFINRLYRSGLAGTAVSKITPPPSSTQINSSNSRAAVVELSPPPSVWNELH